MTPGDILWLFFVFSALQPVLKQRFLDASRQRLIRDCLSEAAMRGSKRRSAFQCAASSSRDFHRSTVRPAR